MTDERTNDEARWDELCFALDLGRTLSPEDRIWLEQQQQHNELLRVESRVMEQVFGRLQAEQSSDADDALADVVQGQVDPGDVAVPKRRRGWLGIALGAMAAAAVAVWIVGSFHEAPKRVETSVALSLPGLSDVERQQREHDGAIALAVPGAAHTAPGCLQVATQSKMCPESGAKLRTTKSRRVELETGRFVGDFDEPAGEPIIVVTHFTEVAAYAAVFTVDVDEDAVIVKVLEGSVAVGDGRAGVVSAGETWRSSISVEASAPRSTAKLSPSELLVRAQEAAVQGEPAATRAAYLQVIRRARKSAEARIASVALAQLELRTFGRPKVALKYFDGYLRGPAKSLRKEAHSGKIESLARLGRRRGELEAIRDFLKEYPGSAGAAKLRARLDELGQ